MAVVSASLHEGGGLRPPPTKRGRALCGPPPSRESLMEAGFLRITDCKLLGFPKGPGTQGPGIQKHCMWRSPMTLGVQDSNSISKVHVLPRWRSDLSVFVGGWKCTCLAFVFSC